jgi:hypothetical protein
VKTAIQVKVVKMNTPMSFLSLVKREGDLGTKVHKPQERFKENSFKNNIKSLAAKAALPLQKGEFSAFTLISNFKDSGADS